MLKPNPQLVDGINIEIETDLSKLQVLWTKLEKNSNCSLFQNFDWNLAWVHHYAQDHQTKVFIVLGYDSTKQLQFILPFQIRLKFGLNILEWLAQSESCYGIGIYENQFLQKKSEVWFSQNFSQILQLLPKIDVINLQNLPQEFDGLASPLTHLNKFEGANCTYITEVNPNYDAILASKRGHNSLKSMRKRDRRLYELGTVEFFQGQVLEQNFQQLLDCKEQQLASQGIYNIFNQPMPKFLFEASISNSAQFQIFELRLNGSVISSMFTAVHNMCFYPLIITLNKDGPLQVSPGDILLRHGIRWACDTGLKRVDFSQGNANFKQVWADKEIELHNFFAAKTLKGLPFAIALLAFNFTKRTIKKSSFLSSQFSKLRQKLLGK